MALALTVGLSGCKATVDPTGAATEGGAAAEQEAVEGGSGAEELSLSPEVLKSLKLTFATVERRPLAVPLHVPAELRAVPDRRAKVGPRVAGRVVEVHANVGDTVAPGAVLVVLESQAVGQAWADLIVARAKEGVSRRTLKRQRRLLKDRITSKRAIEEAEGAWRVARADLEAAETRLSIFGVEATKRAPENRTQVTVSSPLGGEIVARDVSVGQWIQPSDTVVEVIDLDELWLTASVNERQMRFVRPGQPIEIELRAFPGDHFEGKIALVAGTLDERTRTVPVRVVVPNPDHRLRPGMFATARIEGMVERHQTKRLVIPRAAVQELDGGLAVFVQVGERRFAPRRVHTGLRTGDWVEIESGLREGDSVVVEGSFVLKGQLLKSTLGEDE